MLKQSSGSGGRIMYRLAKCVIMIVISAISSGKRNNRTIHDTNFGAWRFITESNSNVVEFKKIQFHYFGILIQKYFIYFFHCKFNIACNFTAYNHSNSKNHNVDLNYMKYSLFIVVPTQNYSHEIIDKFFNKNKKRVGANEIWDTSQWDTLRDLFAPTRFEQKGFKYKLKHTSQFSLSHIV